MKAALRQRPEYIIVGEIRGREAYVLFQAMATGHATYSTVHADSAKSLIHRLEGKPIDIPRIMLQSLDVVSIHITTRVKGKRVRRCKQIIEIIDIDPTTKEILTNEVFKWDPIEDKFIYTGKSYILEGIRARWDMSKEEITQEIRRRAEILVWMQSSDVRTFKEVAKAISHYTENPDVFMKKIKQAKKKKKEEKVEEKEEAEEKIDKTKKKEKSDDKHEEFVQEDAEIAQGSTVKVDDISKSKSNALDELNSIDAELATILFNSGYTSIDALKNASVKELLKIKGLSKKQIKLIKKEIDVNSKQKTVEKQGLKDEKVDKKADEKDEKLEDKIDEKLKEKEPEIKKEEKPATTGDTTFKDIKSIDDAAAKLLIAAGFTSIDSLKNSNVKEIVKTSGLKKKQIKKIINEINKDKTNLNNIDNNKKEKTNQEIEDIGEFAGFESIDDVTAKLLIKNGFKSLDDIRHATIKDLTKIKGIDKKLAKKIFLEIEERI